MNDDLKDLVENPQETQAIELKAWVDLRDRIQQANIARHLAALANHGGGYLIFGIDDDLTSAANRPSSLEQYNRDNITAIIKRYLTPVFQCHVTLVSNYSGIKFPVVRVPSHHSVPIASRADGPHDARGRPQGITKDTYYVRKPGPESAPIIGTEEWNPVIRRCVLNDRDQLLGEFAALVHAPRLRQPETSGQLKRWHTEGENRFLELLSEAGPIEWPVPLAGHRYQLSYLISLDGNEPPAPDSLLDILKEVNNEVRDTVWTGWSMFYPFNDPRDAPAIYPERTDGTGMDLIETNLLRIENTDYTLPDFWRVAPNGRATLVRAYREDRERTIRSLGRDAGTWLSPETVIRETTELVAHANSLAVRMEGATRLTIRCTWIGLKNRQLDEFDPAVYWRPGQTASANQRTTTGEWSIAHSRAAPFNIVAELSCPVLRLFGFRDCSAQFVQKMAEQFVKL